MGPRLKLMLVVEAFWGRRKIPSRNVSNEKMERNKRETERSLLLGRERERGRKENEWEEQVLLVLIFILLLGAIFSLLTKVQSSCLFRIARIVDLPTERMFYFFISLAESVHDQSIHDLKTTIFESTMFGFPNFPIRTRVQSYRIKCTQRLIFLPIQSFHFSVWSSIIQFIHPDFCSHRWKLNMTDPCKGSCQ